MQYRDEITLDVETFSKVDLKQCGLYRYVYDDSFEIILLSYKYKESPVKTFDLLSGDEIPERFLRDLVDPVILKRAHNAQFERVVFSKYLNKKLDPKQWQCTAVKCASLGLPRSLDHASSALKLTETKDKKGKRLITLFCKPRKIPKVPKRKTVDADYFRERNYPKHYPQEWKDFVVYNAQDVIVEDAIEEKLSFFKIPENEHKLWQLDQKINDRGVRINLKLVNAAVDLYETYKDKMMAEAAQLTGLNNPNSLTQLKKWLSEELDEEITKLDKDILPVLIKSVDDETVRRVLEIRQETNKSSVDKYTAMQRAVNIDDFIRGLLAFYGADTGRWSSKIVQLQNLIRNDKKFDLELARKLIIEKKISTITLLWGSISFVLSQCVRTAFIPEIGHNLLANDFSQIESRVNAWCAGEKWKLEAFEQGIDLYKLMGSKMFHRPVETITDDWRQKSKIGELACGYQGGWAAIQRMWPKYLPMPAMDECKDIVSSWRAANPKIKQMWWDVQRAAIDAVDDPGGVYEAGRCKYFMRKDFLFCELPSGRHIVYCRPRIVDGMYGPALECYTVGKNYKWQANSLYGGLLTENLVQGIARDLLGEKMLALDNAGEDICFHVHDEAIIDAPAFMIEQRAKKINRIMREPIEWAKGLPLDAKTDILNFYKKGD